MLKNNSKFEIPEVYGDIKKGYTYITIQPNRTFYTMAWHIICVPKNLYYLVCYDASNYLM